MRLRGTFPSSSSAFLSTDAVDFDKNARIVAEIAASVLETHFGATATGEYSGSAPTFVDNAHVCAAEIRFADIECSQEISECIRAIVLERRPLDSQLQLEVFTDTNAEYRRQEPSIVLRATSDAARDLLRQRNPAAADDCRTTTANPLAGVRDFRDIPLLSLVLRAGRPTTTTTATGAAGRMAPFAVFAPLLTLATLLATLAPVERARVQIERHLYTNATEKLDFTLGATVDLLAPHVKHFLFMASPCGSGKTHAFLRLLAALTGMVRLLATQIRRSLISQLDTLLRASFALFHVVRYDCGEFEHANDDGDDGDGDDIDKRQRRAAQASGGAIAKVMPAAIGRFVQLATPHGPVAVPA